VPGCACFMLAPTSRLPGTPPQRRYPSPTSGLRSTPHNAIYGEPAMKPPSSVQTRPYGHPRRSQNILTRGFIPIQNKRLSHAIGARATSGFQAHISSRPNSINPATTATPSPSYIIVLSQIGHWPPTVMPKSGSSITTPTRAPYYPGGSSEDKSTRACRGMTGTEFSRRPYPRPHYRRRRTQREHA